jgi:hypothetical protein
MSPSRTMNLAQKLRVFFEQISVLVPQPAPVGRIVALPPVSIVNVACPIPERYCTQINRATTNHARSYTAYFLAAAVDSAA